MEKFIPYEKLSKRKKRELMAKKRRTWGSMNPVTRKPENPKSYKREKTRRWMDDSIRRRVFAFAYKHALRQLVPIKFIRSAS